VRLQKKLPGFQIDVAFSCRQGQLLAMIGPSGAGKTTIIRMIAGLEKPDSGRITFNGSTWLDTEKKIFLAPQKRHLGYVFQDYTLFPHLNVEKNVAFAAADRQQAAWAMDLVNIAHLAQRKAHQVSGGERQRIALAQALARKPKILLLDEPFSALDIVTRNKLRVDLKNITTELGLPVVHVTHDLEEAAFLTDHVCSIDQGKMSGKWLNSVAESCSRDSRVTPGSTVILHSV
jgi:molybdate transport system ATP-binding protein